MSTPCCYFVACDLDPCISMKPHQILDPEVGRARQKILNTVFLERRALSRKSELSKPPSAGTAAKAEITRRQNAV